MKSLLSAKRFFFSIVTQIDTHALRSGYSYKLFGIFGLVTYPAYYFVLASLNSEGYENFYLRLIAALLCGSLILKDNWPRKFSNYFSLYWYLVLLYCLPFLFTFFLLKNHFSDMAVLNTIAVLVLAILLLDSFALFVILPIGIFLGWGFFKLTGSEFVAPVHTHPMIVSCISILICAALFSVKKERFQYEKLKTMQSLGASFAHEIRTPLAGIHANIIGVQDYWLELLGAYEMAKKAGLPVPLIRGSQFILLQTSFERIQREVNFSNMVINMLLANVNLGRLSENNLEVCSMQYCVNEALDRYPFSESERDLIQWENNADFLFKGRVLLLTHVLFNLIKNALYHLKSKSDEVEKDIPLIHIWLGSTKNYHQLHFRDIGTGVSSDVLPRIFDPFFAGSRHGSGIGLTFCKAVMESFGGFIKCESVEGSYAEFILALPKF